jgi:hypothetical protein
MEAAGSQGMNKSIKTFSNLYLNILPRSPTSNIIASSGSILLISLTALIYRI